jgi:hypothetical protein
MRLPVAIVCALGLGGCAHHAMGPSEGGISAQPETSFEGAFRSVASGRNATARGDGWIIERVSDNVMRVTPEAGLKRTPMAMTDNDIENHVKERVGHDVGPDVDVQTTAGVVTLRGSVPSEAQAIQAIRDALDTGGVMAVNSELAYPASTARGY